MIFLVAWKDPVRTGWIAAHALLLLAAMWMFLRRIAIGFPHAPTGWVFVTTSLVLVTSCAALRRLSPLEDEGITPRRWGIGFSGSLTIGSLLLLLAITLPNAPLAASIGAWCLVVAGEATWWSSRISFRWPTQFRSSPASAIPSPRPASAPMPTRAGDNGHATIGLGERLMRDMESVGNGSAESEFDEEVDEMLPADVTQQITRMRTDAGGESLFGSLRADFQAGEQQRAVHVMFCPPLIKTPVFHADQSEGPPVTIEVTQLAPYGARLEVRLARPALEAASVVIQFDAREATEATRDGTR